MAIRENQANKGGFAYLRNKYATLSIVKSQITDHIALQRGGLIEAESIQNLTIKNSQIRDIISNDSKIVYSNA